MTDLVIHAARFDALSTRTLYALLKLRADVFVVEQNCPYLDLDGRDPEPTTLHLWAERSGHPVGYLRVVAEPDGVARIGRVCTAPAVRGAGVAGRLLTRALTEIGDVPSRLDAQSHLVDFYTRYGFAVSGDEYVEDGIPHTPMARPAPTPAGQPA